MIKSLNGQPGYKLLAALLICLWDIVIHILNLLIINISNANTFPNS